MNVNAPGKGILKIVSILYIIFGSIFALLMLLSLFLGTMMASWMGSMMSMMGTLGTLVSGLLFVVFLIPAAVDLIIGIIGIKNADVPSKAQFFIVTGIVLTALSVICLIFSFTIWSLIMFAMPVLYIVGGYMNKNAAKPDKL